MPAVGHQINRPIYYLSSKFQINLAPRRPRDPTASGGDTAPILAPMRAAAGGGASTGAKGAGPASNKISIDCVIIH
jgi:hypothetical protein